MIDFTKIAEEARDEYHIPYFVTDKTLKSYAQKGHGFLSALVQEVDYDNDMIARDLLCRFIFYAHNARTADFQIDNMHDINTWQMSFMEGAAEDDTDADI